MGDWIQLRGPSGEYGYINLKTGLFRSSKPVEGTILRTAENSVGYRLRTLKGRNQATAKMVSSYNSRLTLIHNHLDTTNKLLLRHQSVTIDSNGNSHVTQTDYTPVSEAPLLVTGPEKWLVETEAVPFKPLLMGAATLAGRFGSGAILNWGRRVVLDDAFGRFGTKIDPEITIAAEPLDNTVPYNGIRIPIYLKPGLFTGKIEFNPNTDSGITIFDTPKPWKSDPTKINDTRRFYIKGHEDKGYFELVKDKEPQYYSVHFKPTDKDNPHAFSDDEKNLLFLSVSNAIPDGGYLSTWGSLSKGGIHGLNRFGNMGFTEVGTKPALSKSPTLKGDTWTLWEKKEGRMLKLISKGKSGIHIKKKNEGKFTASAKLHGMSVQLYASHVLNDPNATALLKKRANFARNASRWHKNGGIIYNFEV